ncbi:MFS transporter [Streptomyces mashuensis]|nr:MFS transporter [Streptomyces mashuensis]
METKAAVTGAAGTTAAAATTAGLSATGSQARGLRPGAAAPGEHRPRRLTLTVACFGTLLVLTNYCAPMSTLSDTAADLHSSVSGQTWMLSSVMLGIAALLLTTGGLGDAHGQRRAFLAGSAVLAVSTAAGAMATGTGMFVAARIVQGMGSAAILTGSLGIIGHNFPAGPQRTRATGLWGAMVGGGITLGPSLSAALAMAVDWRFGYWVFAAGAVVLTVAVRTCLDESRGNRPERTDWTGAVLFGGAVTALLAALIEGRSGWGRPQVLVLFAVAAVVALAFVVVELRTSAPMLDLRLFLSPGFNAATLGSLFTGLSVLGVLSYLPTVMEKSMGMAALPAGAMLGVWSGTSFVVSLLARRIGDRVQGWHRLVIGMALSIVGDVAVLGIAPDAHWARFLPGLAVSGVGSGLLNAALARMAVESVPVHQAGMGAGANNTARYVGAAIGVALTVVASTSVGSSGDPAVDAGAGMDRALLLSAGLSALGGLAIAATRLWSAREERTRASAH